MKNSSPITMVTSRGKLKAFLIVRAREPCVGWKGRMGGWEGGRREEESAYKWAGGLVQCTLVVSIHSTV